MANVEIKTTGLKCDNPSCDWKDETVAIDDYEKWLDKPCPKCGQNVLTQQDLDNAKGILAMMEMVNAMPKEDFDNLAESLNKEGLTAAQLFEGIPGAELLGGDPEGIITMQVDTHEKIKVVGFKKDQPTP